ncbi:hypothetical protein WA158_007559 [Blastocystis sp. Blastoise]
MADLFATPNLDHISDTDYEEIYEPSDDSFVFLDSLEMEYSNIRDSKPDIIVEVGPGSGILSTFLSHALNSEQVQITFAVDINQKACSITKQTFEHNNIKYGEVIQSDLFRCFGHRLMNSIDILLFNPPYVPSPQEELNKKGIEAAWAGGNDGRVVIDEFLHYIPYLLSSKGRLYLLVEKLNKPQEIIEILQSFGFIVYIVHEKQCFNEVISILCAYRKDL